MSGENNLSALLQSMDPVLREDIFVFSTLDRAEEFSWTMASAVLVFKEEEATTLVIEKSIANTLSLKYELEWAMITLNVHSALDAVGFLARITNALASAGITVNAVSAYYHDHLFVPFEKRNKSMKILRRLSASE